MNRGIFILQFGILSLILGGLMGCQQEDTLFKEMNGKRLGVKFENRVGQSEIFNILTKEHLYNGGGVAIDDFNNDGLQDLFFTGNIVENKLFLNKGNLDFEDVTQEAGIAVPDRWCSGIVTVDINRDGLKDIYISATVSGREVARKNMLFINQGMNEQGIPQFEDQAQSYGIDDAGYSTQAVFFDYDHDDDLDLYVLTNELEIRAPNKFFFKRRDGSAPNTDRLYRNNGDNTFTNVSREAGVQIEGYGLGINVFDINQDGWLDIYVSNDYLSNDVLYINKQDGTFRNEISSYLKHQAHSSMGCDVADINNDGLSDIFTLEMLPHEMTRRKQMWGTTSYTKDQNNDKLGYEYQYMRNMLQVNQGMTADGKAKYGDLSLSAGVYATEWSWSALFNDYDADGYKDLFISNGFPKDITDMDFLTFRQSVNLASKRQALLDALPESKVTNFFYKNKGNLQFEDVSSSWGIQNKSFSNGAAYGDLDNDGDLDIVVNNINENASLLINQSQNINYLQIALTDKVGGAKALGAQVTIYVGGQLQTQHFMPVRGYISCVQPLLFFGLGQDQKVDSIQVKWSDGTAQLESGVQANQKITIAYEGQSFPTVNQASALFTDISDTLDFKHREETFVDFTVQALLPKQFSRMGPSLSIGDIDNNGEQDLIVGGSTLDVAKIFYSKNGSYSSKNVETIDLVLRQEDLGTLLFDADNDGDLDLYVVGGGYESDAGHADYEDRLFINDGKAKFLRAYRRIPQITTSGSVVKGADFDKDGDIDLFVGGRILPKAYPQPVSSFLLRNEVEAKDKPRFVDASQELAPFLKDYGMVTDANWADFDGDGWIDLVIVGEWMAPRFFKNNQGSFEEVIQLSDISKASGWWSSLVSGDFDNDGDTDFMAGNLGTNSFYQASEEMPLYIFSNDFDQNGGYDAFLASTMGYTDGKLYPIHSWGDMLKQMNFLKKKVLKYEDYAKSSLDDLFDSQQLSEALVYTATHLRSSYFENQGNGQFTLSLLPEAAQIAPIQSMLSLDINEDNFLDVVMVGNDFGGDLFHGRYDAFNGLILLGDGKGGFRPENYTKNGFLVEGDARTITSSPDKEGKMRLISSVNKGNMKIFEAKASSKPIGLKPLDAWAMITFADGSKRRIELAYGSSGLAQNSRHLFLPANLQKIQIYRSNGELSYEQ